MSQQNNWLLEQRVAGGTSFASAMLRTQANAETYIKHIAGVVQEVKQLPLVVKKLRNEYEVYCNGQIVWFGRDVDVDLIRTKTDVFSV
ncbi:hypothetical protein ACXYMX_12145 [Sporosarcina sp. CAU 1771]